MTMVYCPQPEDGVALPDPDESHHLAHVLRKRPGDRVQVTDGQGRAWIGEILTIDKRAVRIQLTEALPELGKWPGIHIGIAPPKQAARLEWFLEKATEIGVSHITLLDTARCERSRWRHDRLERILIAAMKQSERRILPVLDTEPVLFSQFMGRHTSPGPCKLIATCAWGNLPALSGVYTSGSDAVILIGPEGDFTSEEVTQSREHGYQPVLMGPHRLRTETAGIVACSQIMLLNERK